MTASSFRHEWLDFLMNDEKKYVKKYVKKVEVIQTEMIKMFHLLDSSGATEKEKEKIHDTIHEAGLGEQLRVSVYLGDLQKLLKKPVSQLNTNDSFFALSLLDQLFKFPDELHKHHSKLVKLMKKFPSNVKSGTLVNYCNIIFKKEYNSSDYQMKQYKLLIKLVKEYRVNVKPNGTVNNVVVSGIFHILIEFFDRAVAILGNNDKLSELLMEMLSINIYVADLKRLAVTHKLTDVCNLYKL